MQSNTDIDLKQQERRGTLAALLCYLLWGTFPLYWKLLGEVNSLEVICHRIIWCFAITWIICRVLGTDMVELWKQPRARKILIPAAFIITVNWGVYIYAVAIDHVVETAIGYYINPLVSILFGLVVFKERLAPLQWVAVGLCAVGVVFFTVNYGQFPWIALVLAFSFGAYGAIKKKGGYPAIQALTFESTAMLPFAIVTAVIVAFVTGSHSFLADTATPHGWAITLLLIGGGPITAVPLILFATAANKIPLSTLGFIQYLSPTIALLTSVFLFGEPFTLAHGVCLGCIWTGLVLVSIETLRHVRK